LRWIDTILVLSICIALSTIGRAEPYSSPSNHFAVAYDAPWSRVSLPDPTAELFIACDPSICGLGTLISIGAFFDGNLKKETLADFLKNAKGDLILKNIKASSLRISKLPAGLKNHDTAGGASANW
jgi:hypothetical protein